MLSEFATAFATIVSLISEFRNINKSVADDDHLKFLDWLSENRHDEIKSLIQQNQETVISVKAILNQDYYLIVEKLHAIDCKLAFLLSQDVLFANLVGQIYPASLLSKQAINILCQFEVSGASKLYYHAPISGIRYRFSDGTRIELNLEEPKFIEDDLGKLIELGFLRQDYNSNGNPIYVYTRLASEFVKSVEN